MLGYVRLSSYRLDLYDKAFVSKMLRKHNKFMLDYVMLG